MKHFLFDLDGTLFEDHAGFDQKAMEILSLVEESGLKYSFTTGRSKVYVDYLREGLVCVPEFISYCNGGRLEVAASQEILFERPFKEEEIQLLRQDAKLQDYLFYLTERGVTSFGGELEEDSSYYPLFKKGQSLDLVWQMILKSIDQSLYDYFRKKYDFDLTRNYKGDDISVDVCPKGVSKGRALTILLENYLDIDEIFVFGDSYNDISNFEIDGFFKVAMASSPDELKHLADYVLSEEQALLEVVRKIIKGELG